MVPQRALLKLREDNSNFHNFDYHNKILAKPPPFLSYSDAYETSAFIKSQILYFKILVLFKNINVIFKTKLPHFSTSVLWFSVLYCQESRDHDSSMVSTSRCGRGSWSRQGICSRWYGITVIFLASRPHSETCISYYKHIFSLYHMTAYCVSVHTHMYLCLTFLKYHICNVVWVTKWTWEHYRYGMLKNPHCSMPYEPRISQDLQPSPVTVTFSS